MAQNVEGEKLGEDEAEEVLDFFSGAENSDSSQAFLSAKTRANMVKYLMDKVGQFNHIEREETKE